MNVRENEMRIMSFNIRCKNMYDGNYNWEHRKSFVQRLIQFHLSDILGCQEVVKEQLEDLKQALSGYDWYGVGRDDGDEKGEYSPIFYAKDKFERLDQGCFWLSENPDEAGSIGWDATLTRIATWVKLNVKSLNKVLYIFNTHFDHEGIKAAEMSSLLLLEKINEITHGQPCLLMGDFNSTKKSPMYQNFTTGGLLDTSAQVVSYGGDVTFHNFEALEGFYQYRKENNKALYEQFSIIDFIFATPDISVVRAGIITDQIAGYYPSDHMPIVCDFLLQ